MQLNNKRERQNKGGQSPTAREALRPQCGTQRVTCRPQAVKGPGSCLRSVGHNIPRYDLKTSYGRLSPNTAVDTAS